MSFELSDLYKLKFEYCADYLFARVGGGKDSLKLSKEYWLRILTEGKNRQFNKILIEEDLDGVLTSSEIYDFSVWLSKQNFNNIFVAFTDLHTDHLESNQLSELIATNRGFRVRVFPSKDEAIEWLASF